jgi:hypothetical protein
MTLTQMATALIFCDTSVDLSTGTVTVACSNLIGKQATDQEIRDGLKGALEAGLLWKKIGIGMSIVSVLLLLGLIYAWFFR